MRKGIGGALLASAALVVSILTGPAVAVAPVEAQSVIEPTKFDFLPHCETPQAMNCVESIEYVLDGQWKTTTVIAKQWVIGDDGNGNTDKLAEGNTDRSC